MTIDKLNSALEPFLQRENLLLGPDGPSLSHPFFTGWKDFAVIEEKGIVGQLVQWLPCAEGCTDMTTCHHPKRGAYVNLPGMESGVVCEGEVMNVGKVRLLPLASLEDMEELLREGVRKLKELVEGLPK